MVRFHGALMNILRGYPPNYKAISKRFDLRGRKAIFAYGDRIYNPSNEKIGPSFIVHEEVHQRQQEAIGGPEIWWKKYMTDWNFMLEQEYEAYGAQYNWEVENNPKEARRALTFFAEVLSSVMYGKRVDVNRATIRIHEWSEKLKWNV